MDFSTLDTNSSIKALKCSICKNYLSYFPILLTKNKLNICGRCEIPEDPENSDELVPYTRNEVYEIAAREFKFPCRYVKEGCTVKLQSKDVPEHENSCPVRSVKCPVNLLDLCDKVVPLPEVGSHCKEAHADLVLKDEKFEIDLLKSKNWNNVVIMEDECLIFKASFESESKNLNCTLLCSDVNQRIIETCKLSLVNKSTSVLKNFSKHRRASFRSNINLKVFEGPGSSTLIKCELLTPKKDKTVCCDNISDTVLEIFKCSSCHKHLKPPAEIYLQNRKIICVSCKNIGNYYMSSYLISSDVFNKVGEKLLYPCQYQSKGCSKTLYPSLLNPHELFCPFRTISCPLACRWTGLAKETVSHISTQHSNAVAISQVFSVRVRNAFGNISVTQSYILKYGSRFFRLCFSSHEGRCKWSVQIIGEACDDFYYEIKVVGDNQRKLITTKKCTPLGDEKLFENNSNFCYFMLDQFEDMLKKNVLIFNVRIFK